MENTEVMEIISKAKENCGSFVKIVNMNLVVTGFTLSRSYSTYEIFSYEREILTITVSDDINPNLSGSMTKIGDYYVTVCPYANWKYSAATTKHARIALKTIDDIIFGRHGVHIPILHIMAIPKQ